MVMWFFSLPSSLSVPHGISSSYYFCISVYRPGRGKIFPATLIVLSATLFTLNYLSWWIGHVVLPHLLRPLRRLRSMVILVLALVLVLTLALVLVVALALVLVLPPSPHTLSPSDSRFLLLQYVIMIAMSNI